MYLLYSLAAGLALVLSAPWWLLRMAVSGKYRAGLSERLGRVPERLKVGHTKSEGAIWFHAVSVGEVLAIGRLAGDLRQRFPEQRIFISTTTAAGQKLARERYGEENVFYFPIDLRFAIRPYIRRLRPQLVVMAETEFWPNFLHECHQSGAKIAVVNGRISDRSLPGYRRWRRLLRPVLNEIDLFLAQSQHDRERLAAIGAVPERTHITGNLKFDVEPPGQAPLAEQMRASLQSGEGAPVLVAGSTMEGEEEILLTVFGEILERYPKSVLVLAPRHPERFDMVAALISRSRFKCWRRSLWSSAETLSGGVFLLDSIGELASIYSLGTLAFVGGSLAPRGGHNILEPAQFGVPIIVGAHTENFRDIIAIFRQADAVRVLRASNLEEAGAELLHTILELLQDEKQRSALGRRAKAVVGAQSGATGRTVQALTALLQAASAQSGVARESSQ